MLNCGRPGTFPASFRKAGTSELFPPPRPDPNLRSTTAPVLAGSASEPRASDQNLPAPRRWRCREGRGEPGTGAAAQSLPLPGPAEAKRADPHRARAARPVPAGDDGREGGCCGDQMGRGGAVWIAAGEIQGQAKSPVA